MPRKAVKLTQRVVDRLPAPDPSKKQTLHFDEDLRGFAVLCSGVSNAKTYVAQRALPDGKTRRVTVGSATEIPLAEAPTRAAETLDAIRQGKDPKAKVAAPLTLRVALDRYLKGNLRPRTKEEYRALIERRLTDWLDRPLAEITRDRVEARHQGIAEEVARAGRNTGHATANGVMRVLRAVWNDAADRDSTLPQHNPVRLRKQWFDQPRRKGLVKADELPKFWQALDQLENRIAADYLKLLLLTGLRRREASTLRWDDLDFGAKVIRIPAARMKGKRDFDVPMSRPVRDLLVARRAIGLADFVFPGTGKSGHIEEPKGFLKQIAGTTGIEVSCHDLRRTYATVAERTPGISPLALKALLNHSTGGDVTAGYVGITIEDMAHAAELVGQRLMQLCQIEALPEDVARL